MTSEQSQQIKDLFDAAFDLTPEERERFLAKACDGDFRLFAEVQKLFAINDDEPDFLEAPPSIIQLSELSLASPDAALDRRIGHYQLIREIGRGGMARVFLANRADDTFEKQVAIKLISDPMYSDATRKRFLLERNILAGLEHPFIARLLDGGTTEEDAPYFVMEFVDGLPINQYCQLHPLGITARLQLFRQVCEAVQYAHQHLVVHRDLKPSNILVTPEGTPKLLDFGIAKLLAEEEASSALTKTQFPFTPEYASPEQVSSQPINTATDIYSLGVLLYELLTGNKPYDLRKLSLSQLAHVICEEAPTVPRLNYELDNILLRALRKEPAARYQSVEQFAEDIRRYLSGEPVLARPTSFAYRMEKFLRKNKITVTLAAILLLTLLAILVTSIRQNFIAKAQAREQRRQLYAAEIEKAQGAWKNNDLLQMQTTLAHWQPQAGEEDLRGFEWGYLQRLLNASSRTIALPAQPVTVAYHPDENVIAVGLEDQRVKLFEATTGRERLAYPGRDEGWSGLVMTATKVLLRLHEQQTIVHFDLLTGQVLHTYTYPNGRIQSFQYYETEPAFYLIADESGALSMIDFATQSERFRLPGQGKPLSFYNYSLPHNLIVTVTEEKNIRVDDLTKRKPTRFFNEPTNIRYVEISEDGQKLFLQNQTELHLRDASTGRILQTYADSAANITFYAITPNNKIIALGKNDGSIELRAFPNFRKILILKGHTRPINRISFLPGNQLLLSTSMDHTMKIWNWHTGQVTAVVRGLTGEITVADVTSATDKFVTASQDRTLRIWNWAEVVKPDVLHGATDHILTVAFSPDGKHVAAAGKDNIAIIHNSDNGEQRILRGHKKMIYAARFSPDGKWLATGSDDGSLQLWDVATGLALKSFVRGTREYYDGVRSLAFLPDGRTVVIGGNDGKIVLWDAINNRVVKEFVAHEKEILSVSVSRDGKLVATGSWDNTAKIWDAATWQERAIIIDHQGHVWSAEFSPDGKQLATGSGDHTIKLWDVATKRLVHTLTGHNGGIFQVTFTSDGQRLATSSDDQTVKLWNPNTGQELLTLRDHTNEVWGVAFSPDGKTLLSGSWDKTLRLWRIAENIKPLQ